MKSRFLICVIPVMLVLLASCGEASKSEEMVDRQEIQEMLEAYLPLLAEAYSSGDLTPLEPYAAQKEISSIYKRVQDLANQGRTLEATLRSVTIEGNVKVWNYSNAYVTTHEVWDLTVFVSGTDQVLGEELEQPNRVKYQLKRENDTWRILYREIQE